MFKTRPSHFDLGQIQTNHLSRKW